MIYVKPVLQERINELNNLISCATTDLDSCPEGHLRISNSSGRTQFYHILKPGDPHGKYIRKSQNQLVRQLAQRQYDKMLLKSAVEERTLLESFLSNFPEQPAEETIHMLSPIRQSMVDPFWIPDEEYLDKWLKQPYEKKPISPDTPDYYTENGDQVRSKSELIIANTLYQMHIPYKYECPLHLKNDVTIHPDFTLLHLRSRKTCFLEHLGMMDDPEYADHALERVKLYIQNNICPGEDLILSHETSRHPLDVRLLKTVLQHVFD